MRCFILTPTYRVVHGTPEVHLYGVLETGEPCLLVDDRARPYFFVRANERDRVRVACPSARITEEALRTFAGEDVVRVEVALPGDVPPLRRRLDDVGITCFEADIRFAYRYMIDRGIRGSVDVSGVHERHDRIGLVFRNPTLVPCHWKPALRILSIDIETDPKGERIYSIALHGCDHSKVLLVHSEHALEHAEVVPNEQALLNRFLGYLDALDPDVITGWNVIDFDLAVLTRAANRHGVRFTVGRTDDEFDRQRDPSFTRESRAVLYGRLVLDGLALMRGAFIRLDDYKLETAAQEFLGRGKLLTGDHRHLAIDRLYRDDPQGLVDYNLEDARLVSDILDRTGLIDLAIERSLLTGMPLDRVSAAIASIDSLYLGELRRRGLVAPSVGNIGAEAQIVGGYVMDSQPGLYRNVLVFDFKSLYPSIIRTFNLDPVTLLDDDSGVDSSIEAPNGARFRRTPVGILPALVATLARERQEAREAGLAVKSNAIKILMNSLYGVLGAGASRLFSPAVANAITHFGQQLIREAAAYATDRGFAVLYGDTDSLFIHAAENDPERALILADQLRRDIGQFITMKIRSRYSCESFLELEFEKLYHRFFLPELRGGKGGSKKRYAGLLVNDAGQEQLEFVGLESKRRDWTDVSKRFQAGLLMRVFHEQPLEDFIRAFIVDLHAGRYDGELVYRKAVRKALSEYTKTTPPHVQAARKQSGAAGRLVEYIVTRAGPEPFGEATAPLDYAHYVEHQLKPIADAILLFLNTDFDTVTGAKRQLSLF